MNNLTKAYKELNDLDLIKIAAGSNDLIWEKFGYAVGAAANCQVKTGWLLPFPFCGSVGVARAIKG